MTFTTFRVESKAYMSYERLNLRGRVLFWLAYPLAAARFYFWTWRDERR